MLVDVPVAVNNDIPPATICGAAYLGFECLATINLTIQMDEWDKSTKEQQEGMAYKYVLLLPEMGESENREFSGRYYFITSEWEEMTLCGNIVP